MNATSQNPAPPGNTAPSNDLEKASLDTVYASLNSSPKGLTSADAKQRIEQYGRNELVEEEISDLQRFLRFFTGPIAYMIEAAAVLSLLMGHWAALTIILVRLFYNPISGFWQKRKASDVPVHLQLRADISPSLSPPAFAQTASVPASLSGP